MANDKNSQNDFSVDDSLRSLEPSAEFEPDLNAARARLRERQSTSRSPARRMARLVLAGAALVVVLLLPWTRAVAQRLWDRLTVSRIEIVQITGRELSDDVAAMFSFEDRESIAPTPVSSIAEASKLAGFLPALPAPDVLRGKPGLAVLLTGRMSSQPVDVAKLRDAVRSAGLPALTVPEGWHGARLTVEGGPAVIASYPDAGIEVIQSRPFGMNVPAAVPFEEFMRLGFRLFGRSEDDAKTLAREIAANPAVVFHFPKHHRVHEVRLKAGRGVVVTDYEGICFFWNTPDRLFIVSAPRMSDGDLVRLADSVAVVHE
jgi:hypothetical protein